VAIWLWSGLPGSISDLQWLAASQIVIEEGAYADILLIDGNPLEDLSVIGTSDKWFDAPERPESSETIQFIMKDGVIYKNTLDQKD
jgi:hypothetical protein